jgi:hypothetical protein
MSLIFHFPEKSFYMESLPGDISTPNADKLLVLALMDAQQVSIGFQKDGRMFWK